MKDPNPAVARDMYALFCDEKIGEGMSRKVFTNPVLEGNVIKIEARAGFFQNVIEWETWQRVKGTEFEKWFAPCLFISAGGTVLIMKRTAPVRPDECPDRMPTFLNDLKRSNYGLLDGRVVCHDYGTNLLMENGMTKRMRKAEWYDR